MEISGKTRTTILVSLVLLMVPSMIASVYFGSLAPGLLWMVLVLIVPRYLEVSDSVRYGGGIFFMPAFGTSW